MQAINSFFAAVMKTIRFITYWTIKILFSNIAINIAGLTTAILFTGVVSPYTALWVYFCVHDVVQWYQIRGARNWAVTNEMARRVIEKARRRAC